MLILLPPSEGKASPRRGRPLDLDALSFPALTGTRRRVLDTLVGLCRGDPDRARLVLGLSVGQGDEVRRNAALPAAATAPAGRIYAGVLYDALALSELSTAAKRRAATRVAVTSALFGLVRLGDRIPAYRLGGGVSLPAIGTVASQWRGPLGEVLEEEARRGLIVDLRSGTYAAFWRPARREHANRPHANRPHANPQHANPQHANPQHVNLVSVRVLQEVDGVRSVVSHFNKATKGRLVAALLTDGANPGRPAALAADLRRLGWQVEEPGEQTLDVIVRQV